MNNDRFKFRVWNEKQGKYLCEEYRSAVLNGDGSLSILDFSDGEITEFSDDAYYGAGNCIIEQCTGLRDKNGKLIYEGDVVRQHGYIMSVFHDDEEGAWKLRGMKSQSIYFLDAPSLFEVIGNIHETELKNA